MRRASVPMGLIVVTSGTGDGLPLTLLQKPNLQKIVVAKKATGLQVMCTTSNHLLHWERLVITLFAILVIVTVIIVYLFSCPDLDVRPNIRYHQVQGGGLAAVVSLVMDGIMKDTMVCISNESRWLCFYAGHDDPFWVHFTLISRTNSPKLEVWRGRAHVADIDLQSCLASYPAAPNRVGRPSSYVEGDLLQNWSKRKYFDINK